MYKRLPSHPILTFQGANEDFKNNESVYFVLVGGLQEKII